MITTFPATMMLILSALVQIENPSEGELAFQEAFQALAAVDWCGLSAEQVRLDHALKFFINAGGYHTTEVQQKIDEVQDIVEQMGDAKIRDGGMDAYCREMAEDYRRRSE